MSTESKDSIDNESVLSRWSRRKQEVQVREASDETSALDDSASLAAPVSDEIAQAPEPLTDADMPDVDSLDEDSDFSGFMSPGVSDELRNLALRKLFHAPEFNIRDGLDEYDEDYTTFEKLGDIVTCDMKHQIEMQEQKQREALEQEKQAAAEAEAEVEVEAVEDIDDVDEVDIDAAEEADEQQVLASAETTGAAPKKESVHE
jgi:hypothetical protein